jgi:hypothetical protein
MRPALDRPAGRGSDAAQEPRRTSGDIARTATEDGAVNLLGIGSGSLRRGVIARVAGLAVTLVGIAAGAGACACARGGYADSDDVAIPGDSDAGAGDAPAGDATSADAPRGDVVAPDVPTGPPMGTLRIAGGTPSSGRLEIFDGAAWGTVCDDGTETEGPAATNLATVACRQLGMSGVAIAIPLYGGGVDPIALDNVSCAGTEARVADCMHSAWGAHNCAHSEDVGVHCNVAEGDLRIVWDTRAAVATSLRGRIEVFHAGVWGTICDDGLDPSVPGGTRFAAVACRQLGFHGGTPIPGYGNAQMQPGAGPITLDDVVCTGSETRVIDCAHRAILTHNCTHPEDMGIECTR